MVWHAVFLCDLTLKSTHGELFVGNVPVVLLKSSYRPMIHSLRSNHLAIIKLREALGYEESKAMKSSRKRESFRFERNQPQVGTKINQYSCPRSNNPMSALLTAPDTTPGTRRGDLLHTLPSTTIIPTPLQKSPRGPSTIPQSTKTGHLKYPGRDDPINS